MNHRTVPLRLLRRGRFKLCPADGARGTHRTIGTVIADCPLEVAVDLIVSRAARLHVGPISGDAEFLDPRHPQSMHQRSLRRRAEQDAMIRNYFISQPPQ